MAVVDAAFIPLSKLVCHFLVFQVEAIAKHAQSKGGTSVTKTPIWGVGGDKELHRGHGEWPITATVAEGLTLDKMTNTVSVMVDVVEDVETKDPRRVVGKEAVRLSPKDRKVEN